MLYLVTGAYVDPGPLLPTDKLVDLLEHAITPSLEMLSQWEKEGRLVGGGIHAGLRVGSMIMEAKDNYELDELLASLPFWGLLRWTVVPLVTFSERAKWERERTKQMPKEFGG